MHVGSLHLYRVPTRGRASYFERARKHIAARLHLVPVFTRRIASLPFDLASPVWVEDQEVDLGHHMRRIKLPKPGTMAVLEATVAKLHGELLDRSRPLWMFYVIEGLATGEVAWYSKIHHATLDGAAGVQLAAAILDETPRGRKLPKPERRVLEKSPGMAALAGAAFTKSIGEFGKLVRSIPEVGRVVADSLGAISSLGASPPNGRRGMPIGPATAFNVPITGERAFATASIPLAQAKAIAKRHDAKVNDVVLALVSGAVRRYLVDRKTLPRKPLVAAMPVSLCAHGDSIYSTRATMVLAWWPVSIVEHGLGLNITVQSYAGSLDFGLLAAKDAMADVRKLAAALYDAHEELKTMRG